MRSYRVLLRTRRGLEDQAFIVDGPDGTRARPKAALILGAPADLVVLEVRRP